MAGEVSFVAENSLTAVALVRLVTVGLQHVEFQGSVVSELEVAFVTKERASFCKGEALGQTNEYVKIQWRFKS